MIERDILTHVGAQVLKKDVLKKNAFVVRLVCVCVCVCVCTCMYIRSYILTHMLRYVRMYVCVMVRGQKLGGSKSTAAYIHDVALLL